MTLDVSSVFAKLRKQELEGAKDDLSLLGDLARVITEREGFVLGSFVYSMPGSAERGFWPEKTNGEAPLFFAERFKTSEFIGQANNTFCELYEEELFISAMIHDLDERRAKRVELVHKTDGNNCLGTVHYGSCEAECTDHDHDNWVIKNVLGNLEKLFDDDNHIGKAQCYAGKITGYFPNADKNYLVVYCPFLVPDGKPPGNFFGVFECNDKCEKLLPFLSDIQLAGTLIFSRMAVDAKLEKLRQEVDELRKLHDAVGKMARVLGKIETIMNPGYMLAGVRALGAMSLGDFFINGDGLDAHDVSGWNDNERVAFVCKINAMKDGFGQLRNELRNDTYERCFHPVELVITRNAEGAAVSVEEAKNAGYFIKAACRDRTCPLAWLPTTLSSCSNDIVKLNNNVPALGFVHAFNALGSVYTMDKADDCLVVNIIIQANDEGELGLQNLVTQIAGKVSADDPLRLHDGHTATALAILTMAASGKDEPMVGDNKLAIKLSYAMDKTR